MKRLTNLNIAVALSIFLVVTGTAKALPNPAAWYCVQLGYEYQIGEDAQGNQYGICVFPDGSECDGWDYFRKCYYGESSASCTWPCQELACREAGESVYLSECCEGLHKIRPAHIFDADCSELELVGWLFLCSDCGNGICEPWESKCNCPEDCQQPRIIYVDAVNGDDSDDGRTPETAYATIQAAIDAAVEDDVVVVAPGTYSGDGNRDIDFHGKAIMVRSTNPNDSNVVTATVIDCNGTPSDPHRGFNFISGEDAGTIVTGLTITKGYAPRVDLGLREPESAGGAILCDRSSPAIVLCEIVGNHANDFGGGMCNLGSDPMLTKCTFIGNSATFAGGMFNYSGSSPMLANCAFTDNSSRWEGGGVYNHSDSNPSFTKCMFSKNTSDRGGGMLNVSNSNSNLTNCAFCANSAAWGGGMMNVVSSPRLTNCVFSGNLASVDGGGVYNYAGTANATNCTFIANSAEEYGGAVCSHAGGSLGMGNCILWENSAPKGPAIAILHGHSDTCPMVSVSYCNVQDRQSSAYATPACADESLDWGNGNIEVYPCFADPGYWDPNGTPDHANDDFWVDGDYHLKSQAGRWDPNSQRWIQDDVTSPCIDAGDMRSPIGYEAFPNGGIVNMGAYGGTAEASKSYFGHPVCETIVAGDINGDCVIDLKDFALMAFHWLEDNNR
jgi:predicted outer membrane repeat protein